MSLSTMRRRNSESRAADTQPGANQREGQARGPTPRQSDGRRDGERLGLGVADRRLNALLEEERARAASLPVQPGMRRLEISDGGRSQPSQPQGGGGQLVGRPLWRSSRCS